MTATEIIYTKSGQKPNGKDLYIPTGKEGHQFSSVADWIGQKKSAGICIKDITSNVLVKGISEWMAFEENVANDVLITIFKIT